jgi:RHS repeat-associated protein
MTSGGWSTWTCDTLNRLEFEKQVAASGGTLYDHRLVHDGDGHRVKQTVNLIVTEFVVDLNGGLSQVVADINSGGNLKVLYVRGDDLISQLQNSEWHWYSYDGHGSTIALTDDAGTQADFYEYDAWGNPLAGNTTGLNRFRYTGQEEDGTGLYYLRARYYGPRIGRFGSRDPAEGLEDDPITLHLYVYARVSPATVSDPSGLQAAVAVAAVGALTLGDLVFALLVTALCAVIVIGLLRPETQDALSSLFKAIVAWWALLWAAQLTDEAIEDISLRNPGHHVKGHARQFDKLDPQGNFSKALYAYIAAAQALLKGIMEKGDEAKVYLVQEGQALVARIPIDRANLWFSDYYAKYAKFEAEGVKMEVAVAGKWVELRVDAAYTEILTLFVKDR